MSSTEIVSSPTSEEKRFAAAYLAATCDELTGAASFHREPGEWCVAEVVEHHATIEGRVPALISRLPDATRAEPDRKDTETDEFIVQNLPRRTVPVQAPEAALPKGQCTVIEALEEFRRKRDDPVRLLECAPCLRSRTLPHPAFGPWDGYQWILATGAHTARHLAQIREIQNHEAFPEPRGGMAN